MVMHVELQATCSALGYQEGKLYIKEPDCLETVKDLIRFLKREDETCDIRRQLGHAGIVQNDLLPILRQYKDETTLWETLIRLLVNLTQPAFLCFNGSIPVDKTMRNYYLEVESCLQAMKEAFICEETFAVLTEKLGELLKLDWEHRQEEHKMLIERLLILIRNILHIPPDPDAEQRTDDDASVHDQILWAIHASGLEDVLLYIASSEEERNLSMHILEIISLMFREQKPEMLASAGSHRSVTEKQKDERELEMVREQERLQKKAAVMKRNSRHSRFGGTFVVKNFKSISDRDLICHKAQSDASRISLDKNKRPKKKPKNRQPILGREIVRRSTLSIRLSLKEFCIQFLENCYNPLMYAVKDILNREKSQEHDETYYLWSIRFFMEFCRLHSGQVDLVSETMSVQTFHYIQVQLFQYYEMQMMEKKEAIVWGKRVHLALKAYQELLLTLDSMDKSNNSTLMDSARVIKNIEICSIFRLAKQMNRTNQDVVGKKCVRNDAGELSLNDEDKMKAWVEHYARLMNVELEWQSDLLPDVSPVEGPPPPISADLGNIFYVMEFRDIFITLLRHFNQSFQSRSYLTDLIETTHLFLKLLEGFSKRTGHLIVQKKGKKGGRKKKPRQQVEPVEPAELSEQQLEDLWDEISSDLSAIFQGREDVPTDVQPFDAASDVDIDQQRVDAMIRIQDCLRNKSSGEAVALFRAAREVWPERNEFGTPDIAPEDEFMALREIFMSSLPRPVREPAIQEEPEENQEEEEEEVEHHVQMAEQEFVFREFAVKFAKPDILKAYVLLIADFQKNSTQTNHCCVKMLHRISVDLGYIGMLFQISLFRVFQKILLSPLAKAERYKELSKFSTYVVRRFVEVAQNNSKIFMELMFWKTSKDAIEVVEGYGSYESKGKVSWTEDAEQEVHRLFEEYRGSEEDGKDTVDHIMERITDLSKTRGQIIRELKKQELITSAKDLKKPKGGSSRAGPWREEDELELSELYNTYRQADDPVGSIMSEMCKKRSRPKIIEKLLSMGLVGDRKDLYKKRASKSGGRRRRGSGSDDGEGLQELPSDFEEERSSASDNDAPGGSSSSSSSDSDDGGEDTAADGGEVRGENLPQQQTMAQVITGLVEKGYKDQIGWIQRLLRRTAEDREEEDSFVPVPIVPLTEENETAMEDGVFTAFLINIGLNPPSNEQECFWRIPPQLSPLDLYNIISGLFLDDDNQPIHADKIKMIQPEQKNKEKKKEKKRKKKKKEDRPPMKNANKFAALRELVKKKAESKKTKRIRKKPVEAADGDDSRSPAHVSEAEEGNQSPARESQTGSQVNTSSKKKKRVKKVMDSDSESDDDLPLRAFTERFGPDRDSQSGTEGGSQTPRGTSQPDSPHTSYSSQKRRRVKKLVQSDSDSDNDVPLTAFTNMSDEEKNVGNTQSDSDTELERQLRIDSQSQSQESNANSQSQSQASDKSSQSQSQSSNIQSQSQGLNGTSKSQSQDSDNLDQSQDSAPLLFLSSSDESDQDDDSKVPAASDDLDKVGTEVTSKRSRSVDSDPEGEGQRPKKKVKILDSDSEDDRPLSAVAEETFPATLYTQGPDSDSDLDDHVPLRKVVQKKNIIESDSDD